MNATATKQPKKKMTFTELRDNYKRNQYYNFPNNFGDEGVDHYNINISAESFIGKLFSADYRVTIEYPYLGKFPSVMSLHHWVKSKDKNEVFRSLTGDKLRNYVVRSKEHGGYAPNFKAIIALATWIKINKYPRIVEQLKDLDTDKIKFLSYTTVSGSCIRTASQVTDFYVDIANRCVEAIKKGVEPDFSDFCDKPEQGRLGYAEGVLRSFLGHPKVDKMFQEPAPKVSKETIEDDEDSTDDVNGNIAEPSTTPIVEEEGIAV